MQTNNGNDLDLDLLSLSPGMAPSMAPSQSPVIESFYQTTKRRLRYVSDCDLQFYYMIPTPTIKINNDPKYIADIKKCTWAWMKKYEGKILYTNKGTMVMNKDIGDLEAFEKNHVGDIMLLWMKFEYYDPFQNIHVIPKGLFIDPNALQNMIFRQPGMDDKKWAVTIMEFITGEKVGDVNSSKDVEYLLPRLQKTDILNFTDYVDICDKYMLNPQNRKFAKDLGCIF
jgi:hypothetical protein